MAPERNLTSVSLLLIAGTLNIIYDHARGVADGYVVVAKLYDRDTSSEEAHTAALIAIEGRLNLIAHCLRAMADNSGADMSSVSMLGPETDNEEAHQQAGLRGN